MATIVQGLSRTVYISPNCSLIELDSNLQHHIQLCGYLRRGFPLCELLRHVNTSTTVTGTIIYLGSVLHWYKLCVRCCQLLINPCGVSQNTVEDIQRERMKEHIIVLLSPCWFLHSSIDSFILLHNISSFRFCVDMLTGLAYPVVFQLDPFIFSHFFYGKMLHS